MFAILQSLPKRSRVPGTRNYPACQSAEANEPKRSFKTTQFTVNSTNAPYTFILPHTRDAAQLYYPRRAKLASSPSYSHFHCFFVSPNRHRFPTLPWVMSAVSSEEAEMQPSSKKKSVLFTWAVSHKGIPGFEGLGFNFLLSTGCVAMSRVRLVVSNFWCIFHPGQANFLSQPQLLNIATLLKSWL